jgi:hypothetical protein
MEGLPGGVMASLEETLVDGSPTQEERLRGKVQMRCFVRVQLLIG